MSEIPKNLVSMTRSQLTSHLLQLYGWGPAAVALIAMLPALVAGIIFDIRWLIVFFLIMCLAVPMIMAFLFFYHGLRPSTSSNILPHTVEIGEVGITVSSYRKINDSDSLEFIVAHTYPFSSIRRLMTNPDGITVLLLPPDKGFLWIPLEAFPSRAGALDAFRKLNSHLADKG